MNIDKNRHFVYDQLAVVCPIMVHDLYCSNAKVIFVKIAIPAATPTYQGYLCNIISSSKSVDDIGHDRREEIKYIDTSTYRLVW